MPHAGHVVITIEITATVNVVQPYALAPNEMYGIVVEQWITRPKKPNPPFD